MTWVPQPSLGSILIARKEPEIGGDTLFVNKKAAYEDLDESKRAAVDDRCATHLFQPMRQYLW